MPGLCVGQSQQRKARRAQHAAGPGEKGAEKAHAQSTQPPPDAQVQVPGDFSPIQAPQAGGDI
nr:hypothetical protein [Tanacetum cinerariifolium]